jgi:hypothetical protein
MHTTRRISCAYLPSPDREYSRLVLEELVDDRPLYKERGLE